MGEVRRLYRDLVKHTTVPFSFIVLNGEPEYLPRNLRKMEMFKPGLFRNQVFCFDLDTRIVGNIDEILSYRGDFATLQDWYEDAPAAGGGIVSFRPHVALSRVLWTPLQMDLAKCLKVSKGGSERYWYRAQLGTDIDYFQDMYPGYFVDAKPREKKEIIEEVPEDARVVCFHGSPRPWEVERDWMK